MPKMHFSGKPYSISKLSRFFRLQIFLHQSRGYQEIFQSFGFTLSYCYLTTFLQHSLQINSFVREQIIQQLHYQMKEIRDLFQDFTCQICYRPYSKQFFPIIICQSFHIICVECNEKILEKFQQDMEQQEYQNDITLDCPFCKIPMIERVYFPKLFCIKDIVCKAEENSQTIIKELEEKVQRLEKDNKALVEEKQGKRKAMKKLFQANSCLKKQVKNLQEKIKFYTQRQEKFLPLNSQERLNSKNSYIYDLISKQKKEERMQGQRAQENTSISYNTSQRRAESSRKDTKPDQGQYLLKAIKTPARKQLNRQKPESIKPFLFTCYRQTANLQIKKSIIKK